MSTRERSKENQKRIYEVEKKIGIMEIEMADIGCRVVDIATEVLEVKKNVNEIKGNLSEVINKLDMLMNMNIKNEGNVKESTEKDMEMESYEEKEEIKYYDSCVMEKWSTDIDLRRKLFRVKPMSKVRGRKQVASWVRKTGDIYNTEKIKFVKADEESYWIYFGDEDQRERVIDKWKKARAEGLFEIDEVLTREERASRFKVKESLYKIFGDGEGYKSKGDLVYAGGIWYKWEEDRKMPVAVKNVK